MFFNKQLFSIILRKKVPLLWQIHSHRSYTIVSRNRTLAGSSPFSGSRLKEEKSSLSEQPKSEASDSTSSEEKPREFSKLSKIPNGVFTGLGKLLKKPLPNQSSLPIEKNEPAMKVIEISKFSMIPKGVIAAVRKAPRKSTLRLPIAINQAGVEVRLPKVPQKNFIQPENSKLLKVSILGAPNAGKSTMLNALIGETVSIVSDKPHTTREQTLAVMTEKNQQIVFIDTPGVVIGRNRLRINRDLVNASWHSLSQVDHYAYRAIKAPSTFTERLMFERLKDYNIDRLNAADHYVLRSVTEKYCGLYESISDSIKISAVTKQGLTQMKDLLFSKTYPHDWLYPPNQKTEMADLKMVEELIRAEFFKRLHGYLPYIIKQENFGWTIREDGVLRIDQYILVGKESQEKIVIGKRGNIINEVVEYAQEEISRVLKRPVKLFLKLRLKPTF
ncbi:hypothetical protein G9A89_011307 [Geosiphon pyriformis]|nr:hypothetical protein G9A89_011307 [Geosiphon pyriformis]